MVIEKKKFSLYNLEGNKQDIITMRLNPKERELLERDKQLLNMDRDGTTIKALVEAGRIVLHDRKTKAFFKIFLRIQRKGHELDL